MSFLIGSDGEISLFRVGSLIAVIGILLVAGGVAAYVIDQNSYKVPLEVDPFPGADVWGTPREQGATSRTVYRIDSASTDDVAAYYSQKLQAFSSGDQGCVRTPLQGTFPGADSDPSVVPYMYKCLFQRSGLGVSQETLVTIEPGVFNQDAQLNTQGSTVIEHSQRWQP